MSVFQHLGCWTSFFSSVEQSFTSRTYKYYPLDRCVFVDPEEKTKIKQIRYCIDVLNTHCTIILFC